MQTPIILSDTHGLTFKKDLTQIEYYGIYAFVAAAYNHAAFENGGLGIDSHDDLNSITIEYLFGFAPYKDNVSCTNHVEWPGFEHLGPVDYFELSENHILCAVYVYDDADTVYLRLN